MKKILFLTSFIFIFSGLFLSAQTKQINIESLFKDMYKKQLTVVKEKKFTKAEVTAVDRALKNTGTKILAAVKAAPGETHQYMIDKVKKEFKALNIQLGKVLPADKLTPFKSLLSKSQVKLINQLQTQYVGGVRGIRAGIRTNLRAGIRVSLMKGFGGQDLGNY